MSHQFIALVRRGATTEIAEQVKENPSIAQSRDAQGVSALLWAVYSGQTVIRDFLHSGLESLDVHEAAAVGDIPRLQALLAGDPTPTHDLARAVSSDGWPPLHLAAAFGGTAAVKLLLKYGADVHQVSPAMRNQAIHAALALNNDPETVRALLDHGADINAAQMGGYTPLHQAASAGKSDLAETLLAAGADPTKKCDRGKTPADYADEKGHAEFATRLRLAES